MSDPTPDPRYVVWVEELRAERDEARAALAEATELLSGVANGADSLSRNVRAFLAFQEAPTETTHCAGRSDWAHARTPMVDGVCPICGEEESPTHPDGTVCPERPGLPCPVCALQAAGA